MQFDPLLFEGSAVGAALAAKSLTGNAIAAKAAPTKWLP